MTFDCVLSVLFDVAAGTKLDGPSTSTVTCTAAGSTVALLGASCKKGKTDVQLAS